MTRDRYIVRSAPGSTDGLPERPQVIDTETGESLCEPWALNDWGRAEAFAAGMNADAMQEAEEEIFFAEIERAFDRALGESRN